MTTQTLTTYRIRYRRPNAEGPHGYEDRPEFDMREITVTLCAENHHIAYARAGVIGDRWQGRGVAEGLACDMCERPGQGLLAIVIERALGV